MKENAEPYTLDANKFLNSKTMRINLLLSSLYLAAYEILKATIIEGVKKVIIYLPEPNENAILTLKSTMSADEFQAIYDTNIVLYKKLIKEYERTVDVQFEQQDRFGLIPSCNWLKKEAILSEQDIETIRKIRDHRNHIAHELPSLLISKGFDVDLDYLEQIINILRKIEPFFARIDADIPADVPDKSIMSGGQLILGMVWNAVTEYLQELSGESL